MRTLLGLILSVAAYGLLSYTLALVSDPAGMAEKTGVYPFAPPPWQLTAGVFLVAALMGCTGAWLLSRGLAGRMVRGRGLSPEPVRR
jgi:hypothetical protein